VALHGDSPTLSYAAFQRYRRYWLYLKATWISCSRNVKRFNYCVASQQNEAFVEDARQRAQRRGIEALPDFLTCLEIEYRARIRMGITGRDEDFSLQQSVTGISSRPIRSQGGISGQYSSEWK
jgi:hypothetical protein